MGSGQWARGHEISEWAVGSGQVGMRLDSGQWASGQWAQWAPRSDDNYDIYEHEQRFIHLTYTYEEFNPTHTCISN